MQQPSILIIDDEPNNVYVIQTLLSTQGYQFHYAANGLEAIANLSRFDPDLILLDVMMPGMDGVLVCQQIKADPRWQTVPIVMVTALSSKIDMAQCLNAGADDFISKPLNRLELSARVHSMLRIRELNLTLEDRVNSRTVQLTEANIALARQIRERTLAQEALRHSESRFRALIENSSDLILLLSPQNEESQHKILYASPSVERNLGYFPTDIVDQPLTLWIHPQDQENALCLLTHALGNRYRPYSNKLRWRHHSGAWCVFETIVQHFADSAGFSGIVVNARDITERLRVESAERALEQEKELSELKLRFFSTASHELRTPLSVILMAARILHDHEHSHPDDKRYRNIQRILSSANTLKLFLSDILHIARLEARQMEFKPQLLGLSELCDCILEPYQTTHNGISRINYTYSGPKTEIMLDSKLVTSILTNLLTNALKYSTPEKPVQFQVFYSHKYIKFKISDRGIGIPAADQSRLFETFQRGDNVGSIEGTGLGLAIVRQCVSLHNGQITFNSTLDQGTTFIVNLPYLCNHQSDHSLRAGDFQSRHLTLPNQDLK